MFETIRFMRWPVISESLSSVSLKFFVVYIMPASQQFPRAHWLITKAGVIWQERASVHPERVFAHPWSSEVLLGAMRCDASSVIGCC